MAKHATLVEELLAFEYSTVWQAGLYAFTSLWSTFVAFWKGYGIEN